MSFPHLLKSYNQETLFFFPRLPHRTFTHKLYDMVLNKLIQWKENQKEMVKLYCSHWLILSAVIQVILPVRTSVSTSVE